MPKYWGKQIFSLGRFPEVGQNQKTEKEKKRGGGAKVGDNNGQATHGARKHAWRTQAAWANIMFVLRICHNHPPRLVIFYFNPHLTKVVAQYKRARFGLALIEADQSPNMHFQDIIIFALFSLSSKLIS